MCSDAGEGGGFCMRLFDRSYNAIIFMRYPMGVASIIVPVL